MHISALTVCVNYTDLLAKGLVRWKRGVDKLVVVTSHADQATRDMCVYHGIGLHVTDIFYANGAAFNKGAALSEAAVAFDLVGSQADWLLGFDSDIVPPWDWRQQLEAMPLRPDTLYGSYRYQQPEGVVEPRLDLGRKMPQGWVIGFFSLFHARDPRTPKPPEPLFDLHWPHAGNYDTVFTRRWPDNRQVILPNLHMIHIGEERQNWCGRTAPARHSLRRILRRRRRAEDWNQERMPEPPSIHKPKEDKK